MEFGGFQKLSLIDYPGKLSALVFTPGCNFRCPFCHNSDLVLPEKISKLKLFSEEYILKYLFDNNKKIQALSITGGEPTVHSDLPEFIAKVKKEGFLVKLDTNGTNPAMLRELFKQKLLDYVAMDIKADLSDASAYNKITGKVINDKILSDMYESIDIIKESGIPHEFRTTVISGMHSLEDLRAICDSIEGADAYFIQKYIPENAMDTEFSVMDTIPKEALDELEPYCSKKVKKFGIRY